MKIDKWPGCCAGVRTSFPKTGGRGKSPLFPNFQQADHGRSLFVNASPVMLARGARPILSHSGESGPALVPTKGRRQNAVLHRAAHSRVFRIEELARPRSIDLKTHRKQGGWQAGKLLLSF